MATHHLISAVIGTVLFFSCGNDDDDTLKQPLEEQSPEAVPPPSTDKSPAEATPQLDVATFTIDATNGETQRRRGRCGEEKCDDTQRCEVQPSERSASGCVRAD